MNDSLMGRRRSINHEKTADENEQRATHAKLVAGVCPTCGRKKPTRKTSSRRTKKSSRVD